MRLNGTRPFNGRKTITICGYGEILAVFSYIDYSNQLITLKPHWGQPT